MAVLEERYTSNEIVARNGQEHIGDLNLLYYASEIMEKLGCSKEEEMDDAVNRGIQVCEALNIPLKTNFKRIYRYDGYRMKSDWKISSLAGYLLMINGNPCNPNVAKAQLFFATRNYPSDNK